MLYACQDRYGDMFTIRVAYEGTWVMLADPEAIKQVFTGDPRVFHAGEGNEILAPLLGRNSLLVLDEKRHMSQRKLLLPPFHGERMQGYAQTMGEIAEREIDSWPTGTPYKLRPRMQALTLEIILRTVFGVGKGEADKLADLRERPARVPRHDHQPTLPAAAAPRRAQAGPRRLAPSAGGSTASTS